MSALKTYLGDAVYADVMDYGGIILTTENGCETTNIIALEPEVMTALFRFIERINSIRKAQNEPAGKDKRKN